MRIDKYSATHYGSRTKAADAADRGEIRLNGKIAKPSDEVKEGDKVEFIEPQEKYVSHGGAKLARAIETFQIDCEGKIFADIGASTGGFTDCLLQHGARKVYCVDVGESLLDQKLQGNERIVSMENTNARYLTEKNFADVLDGAVIDVSFISLRLILPILYNIVKEGGIVLALIKPQFECEDKKLLSKSGIVTDPKLRKKIVAKIYAACVENGLQPLNIVNAPVREKKNIEYVIYLKKGEAKPIALQEICDKADKIV
jgi:23S rRNA (cytidine1920-2'-O)/16S rRNA (cytidine1409-2'-O)-methyltransferase